MHMTKYVNAYRHARAQSDMHMTARVNAYGMRARASSRKPRTCGMIPIRTDGGSRPMEEGGPMGVVTADEKSRDDASPAPPTWLSIRQRICTCERAGRPLTAQRTRRHGFERFREHHRRGRVPPHARYECKQ